MLEYFDFLKFVYRPKNLIGNEISMNKIIASTLSECKNESIIQTHTTNPLLTAKTIDAAIEKHDKTKKDYFSVTKLQDRLFDGDANPINHDINELIQTQDLEPLYIENSDSIFFQKIILIVEKIEFLLTRYSLKQNFQKILILIMRVILK